MPHDYNPKTHQFKTPHGRRIPIEEVRREVDKLVSVVGKKAVRLGNRYASGEISLVEFHIEMRELLKAAHIVAASIGKGGRRRMTQSDWGRVGARLKGEYGYLARFIRKLETGKAPKVVTPNRAKRYSNGVVMSYHDSVRQEHTDSGDGDRIQVRLITNSKEGCSECAADESRGWVDPADMAELGTRICGNFCLCSLIFEDDWKAGRVTF